MNNVSNIIGSHVFLCYIRYGRDNKGLYKMSREERNREKFIELAEKRVNKTLKAIHLVGNLSNKSNYQYSDEDAQKIIRAIENEVKILKSRFESKGNDQTTSFTL